MWAIKTRFVGSRVLAALLLLFCISASSALAATATRELHIVAVHHGNIRTAERIHGPQVHINVTRPGKSVILALNARKPIRFLISVDDATQLEDIYLFGRFAAQSEAVVNDRPARTIFLPDIPQFDHDTGLTFRQSLHKLTARTGTDRATSVTVKLHRLDAPIPVNRQMTAPQFQRRYIQQFVDQGRMTPRLTAILNGNAPGHQATFSEMGFTLRQGDNTQVFPVTLDVPPIEAPANAAYDPDRNLLYGLSTGGEGFLYRFDIAQNQWSAPVSLRNQYAYGMIFDANRDRLLIAAPPRGRSTTILKEWSQPTGLRDVPLKLSLKDLPGLIDLINPDKRSRSTERPVLIPLAIDGDLLLLRALPRNAGRDSGPDAPLSRTYLVNVETSATTLVGYTGE